ncbi:hypothetical protein NA57DRAFT_51282 [Rhizodiscina lignyota]|uniref:Uncharacterized protein n=1 Tax=Rhizodiscina lignyota TaxID=1504668 RepID=A0A9P4MAV8_9PEZI|nr:hypothetical protein NA57DRAFT_51282 [Rhizodiscina lignyota]
MSTMGASTCLGPLISLLGCIFGAPYDLCEWIQFSLFLPSSILWMVCLDVRPPHIYYAESYKALKAYKATNYNRIDIYSYYVSRLFYVTILLSQVRVGCWMTGLLFRTLIWGITADQHLCGLAWQIHLLGVIVVVYTFIVGILMSVLWAYMLSVTVRVLKSSFMSIDEAAGGDDSEMGHDGLDKTDEA